MFGSVAGMSVTYERHGSAALLTIDRPERRNAIDGPTAAELLEGFEAFVSDHGARVLVLTGAGDAAFCAGADLKNLASLNVDLPGGPLGFTRLTSPKPTIAAVSGWALAGGFELALWCDLRIATQNATFGFAERRWGVPLIDGGTQRLPRIIGMGRALELILSGRMVGAEEAGTLGLANEVVPDGTHVKRALELAETLAGFPQETMLSDRRAALEGFGMPLEQALAHEAMIGRERSIPALEGAQRFADGAGRGGVGV